MKFNYYIYIDQTDCARIYKLSALELVGLRFDLHIIFRRQSFQGDKGKQNFACTSLRRKSLFG